MLQHAGKRIAVVLGSLIVLGGSCAAGYREEAIANGGRIVGTVRVTGDVTPLPPQPVFKERDFCGETVPDERLVVDPAGHLGNAVVHLVGIQAGKPVPPAEPVRLENRCACDSRPGHTFQPRHSEGPHSASGARDSGDRPRQLQRAPHVDACLSLRDGGSVSRGHG